MLLWRAVSPRAGIALRRNVIAPPRRFVHPSRPWNQHLNPIRPPGLLSKLYFRADGTQRSVIKGLFYGSLVGVVALTLWSVEDIISEYDTVNYVLTTLVYLQQVYAGHRDLDVSNHTATRDFFYGMVCAFPDTPQSVIDEFFVEIDRVLAVQSSEGQRIQQCMRDSVQEIGELVKELRQDRDDMFNVGLKILKAMDLSILTIVDLVREFRGEEDPDREFLYRTLKENKSKTVTTRGQEYDSIG
ncbi:hypothetical protein FA15DRAFT_649791 [Coprinopsis marcescibilis]|uniref:Uncharacterized protein n=1 Tax=Coprinopsis marcescibilis TaxID=230819 RepID=A0A5C3KE41_COPMA|nr:hypothetical protein FA15DRAFT_649791 [Coprinopsis marcescibilis]